MDCINNLNKSTFEPIIDEVHEISHYNHFHKKISNFLNNDILKKEIKQKFGQKPANVKDNDPFKASRITSINNEKSDEVDALELLKEKELKTVMKKLKIIIKSKKIKTIIVFDCNDCYSIKSFSTEKIQ